MADLLYGSHERTLDVLNRYRSITRNLIGLVDTASVSLATIESFLTATRRDYPRVFDLAEARLPENLRGRTP